MGYFLCYGFIITLQDMLTKGQQGSLFTFCLKKEFAVQNLLLVSRVCFQFLNIVI